MYLSATDRSPVGTTFSSTSCATIRSFLAHPQSLIATKSTMRSAIGLPLLVSTGSQSISTLPSVSFPPTDSPPLTRQRARRSPSQADSTSSRLSQISLEPESEEGQEVDLDPQQPARFSSPRLSAPLPPSHSATPSLPTRLVFIPYTPRCPRLLRSATMGRFPESTPLPTPQVVSNLPSTPPSSEDLRTISTSDIRSTADTASLTALDLIRARSRHLPRE